MRPGINSLDAGKIKSFPHPIVGLLRFVKQKGLIFLFDHVGSLANDPPTRPGCSSSSHPTTALAKSRSNVLRFYEIDRGVL